MREIVLGKSMIITVPEWYLLRIFILKFSLFTLTKPELRTLAVGIVNLKDGGGEGVSAWNLMNAGTVISILPMIIVYLAMNKYFLSGLSEGAVKG